MFSTRFVEPNTALREFLKHIKERYPDIDLDTVEPFYIPIKHGYRRKAWSKNVVGIGLSYGFVEPLESTGLLTTHENIIKLVDTLNRREGYTTQIERDAFNGMCQKNVLTFSMHCASNYPARKSKSDIDIELQDQMEDEKYLNILHANLKELNKNKYDFVFYIAGVDIHYEDRLGKLKITDEGINKRDQIVIENFYSKNTPLCGVLGGGYNKSFEKLIELHSMLHKNCAKII